MRVYIFTPTYHRFEVTKDCLLSLKKVIEGCKNDCHIELFIGDNNSPKKMKKWLRKTFKGLPYHYTERNSNIGKPAIINEMWESCDKNCDVVCSIDSDMVVPNTNWIDRCVDVIVNRPAFGLISTNQLGQCCHLWDKGLTEVYKHNGNTIRFGLFNSVAGGCIFLTKKSWVDVGGYRVGLPVYGGDDAYLMLSVAKKLDRVCGIIENV